GLDLGAILGKLRADRRTHVLAALAKLAAFVPLAQREREQEREDDRAGLDQDFGKLLGEPRRESDFRIRHRPHPSRRSGARMPSLPLTRAPVVVSAPSRPTAASDRRTSRSRCPRRAASTRRT